jgi:hypothetical protein
MLHVPPSLWLLALALLVSGGTRNLPELRSGDLVFQTSRTAQSTAIQQATGSAWTHVGVVEVASDGIFVIEAVGPVSRTSWQRWRARGVGKRVLVKRAVSVPPEGLTRVVAEARQQLGKPYDPLFDWGDDAFYCSELVHKAFARGAGVTLGRFERLGDLRLAGLESELQQRYRGRVPLERLVVTPASIAAEPKLAVIFESP